MNIWIVHWTSIDADIHLHMNNIKIQSCVMVKPS